MDETDAESLGRDSVTAKVRGVIVGATKQLVPGESNLVVLTDWSATVARANLFRAVEALADEIAANGTYGRISAVEYDSNWLGPTNSYLWTNSAADTPLPDEIQKVILDAAKSRSDRFRENTERMIHDGHDGRGD